MNKEQEYTALLNQQIAKLKKENLEQHGQLKRQGFDILLMNKLPDMLSEEQKLTKIGNLLTYLRIEGKIEFVQGKLWQLKSDL